MYEIAPIRPPVSPRISAAPALVLLLRPGSRRTLCPRPPKKYFLHMIKKLVS